MCPFFLFSQKFKNQNCILVRGVLYFIGNQSIIHILEQRSLILLKSFAETFSNIWRHLQILEQVLASSTVV